MYTVEELKESLEFYTMEVRNLTNIKQKSNYEKWILAYNKEMLKELKIIKKDMIKSLKTKS